MNLPDAVAAITAAFPVDHASDIAETVDMTSGGLRSSRDVEPALYATRDLAVANWHRETMALLGERNAVAVSFLDGPHLDKWHITVMDRNGTHRVAEPRWSVTAKVGLIVHTEDDMSALTEVRELKSVIDMLTERVAKLETQRVEPPAEPAATPVVEAGAPSNDGERQ